MTDLHAHATELFADLRLEGDALGRAWTAFEESAEGTVKVALSCFGEGIHSPDRLFVWFLGRGEHKRVNGQRRTGWERKTGTHGDSYVRNPRGVDPLPRGFAG